MECPSVALALAMASQSDVDLVAAGGPAGTPPRTPEGVDLGRKLEQICQCELELSNPDTLSIYIYNIL